MLNNMLKLRKRLKTIFSVSILGVLVTSLFVSLTPFSHAQESSSTVVDASSAVSVYKAKKTLTLIQIGDLHGHLIPRPNLRSSDGLSMVDEGGLARIYTLISQIRAGNPKKTLLFNTGDTIQGGAEALYSNGQAMVDILDTFAIDGFAAGNWDWVYGVERFVELFGPGTGPGGPGNSPGGTGTRWGAVAANAYYDSFYYPDKAGQLILPPYIIKRVNGLKIGILGLTTDRLLGALGPWATAGVVFTDDGAELPYYINILRNEERVDLVILVSEFGLSKNILLAEKYPGINVVFSADMHEVTPKAVVTSTGTIVSEAGQDGTRLAELRLIMKGKTIVNWEYIYHTVTEDITSDPTIAAMVEDVRKYYVDGPFFEPHVHPINGTELTTPIDTIVGYAAIDLYRGNFSNEDMPGVIEGASSDFLSDAFRDQAMVDIGHIRGFRYGTHIRQGGAIKLEDIYHYIPIGPQIAKTTITGAQLKTQLETTIDGCLTDPFKWGGGWVNGYGGVTFDLNPYASNGNRTSNIMVNRYSTGTWEPLNTSASYGFAGYWYSQNPYNVGGLTTTALPTPVTGSGGETLDATQVVVNYLNTLPGQWANPELHRINLLYPLPEPSYGNPEIQPLLGVATTMP